MKKLARHSLVIGALAGGLLLAGCSSHERPASAESAPAVAVKTQVIEPAALADTFQAPGTVRARKSAAIAAKVSGYVQDVRVKPGDRVAAGQTLVILQAQDLDAQVARANAGQHVAGSAVLEAERARAVADSQAQLAAATYQRYKGLIEKRSVSRQEFDEVEARHKAAQANLEMVAAAIGRARAAQRQAEAEVKAAGVMRGYAVLAAPFSGIVSEKHVDPGALAMPGLPLLVVEQVGDYRLEAAVEESRSGAVKLGDKVSVEIEALGRAVEGRVGEIVPAVDASSRAFLVKIDLPGMEKNAAVLRSGMFGRAAFVQGVRQAIAVPAGAVQSLGQLSSVFVSDNGTARQRLVTIGSRSGDRVEVLTGLSSGDRVILASVPGLRDGVRLQEVRP